MKPFNGFFGDALEDGLFLMEEVVDKEYKQDEFKELSETKTRQIKKSRFVGKKAAKKFGKMLYFANTEQEKDDVWYDIVEFVNEIRTDRNNKFYNPRFVLSQFKKLVIDYRDDFSQLEFNFEE